MGNPQNRQQKRKYRFKNNQHANQQKRKKVADQKQTLRAKKISQQSFEGDGDSFFMLINFKILKDFVEGVAVCPECKGEGITFSNVEGSRMGLACMLKLSCNLCPNDISLYTSRESTKNIKKPGRNLFEANVRTVAAFREIGKGHEAGNSELCTYRKHANTK